MTRYMRKPTVDRAWELLDVAYSKHDVKVLGWADDMVMVPNEGDAVTFTVHPGPASPCGHEDMVVVVAFRVPHPDEMTLAQVLDMHPMDGLTDLCENRSSGEHDPMEYAEDDGVRLMCEACGLELDTIGTDVSRAGDMREQTDPASSDLGPVVAGG